MRVLSRLFRRRFLEALQQAHRDGRLQFFGEHAHLAQAAAFARWLAPLHQCEWVVYAKRPFAGPEAVLAAARAGQRAFGENYVQEAVDKIAALARLAEAGETAAPGCSGTSSARSRATRRGRSPSTSTGSTRSTA